MVLLWFFLWFSWEISTITATPSPQRRTAGCRRLQLAARPGGRRAAVRHLTAAVVAVGGANVSGIAMMVNDG